LSLNQQFVVLTLAGGIFYSEKVPELTAHGSNYLFPRGFFVTTLPFPQPCGLSVWTSEVCRPDFRLHQGFCYSPLEECKDAFRFAVLTDSTTLRQLIHDCAALVSDESFFVLEYYPDKVTFSQNDPPVEPTVFYSPYMETEEILAAIDPYLSRLIHDGFVGFGLANSRLGAELFYSEEKAFTCFTANHIRTMNILSRHGLRYREELLFPADFAHDHLSLVSLDKKQRPQELKEFTNQQLDYITFCGELVDLFDMQPTSSTDDFFLSCKEQDSIETFLSCQPDLNWSGDEEFINLLLDWKDFVNECCQGFNGCLDDYRQGLKIRDIIDRVIDQSDATTREKLLRFIAESDALFRCQLIETTRQMPTESSNDSARNPRFWRWGVARNHGSMLRRDLIRRGWYSYQP
jgi:hypothetical protein